MADPIALQIVDTIATLLAGIPGIAEIRTMSESEPASFPALHIDDEGEDPTAQDHWRTRASLSVAVLGYCKGGGDATWREARMLDSQVIAALMANQQLGGLATKIDLGGLLIETVKVASTRSVSFRRMFAVDFSFETTDPAAIGG